MNRKTLFAALACALLVFSMLGCGASNKLQSIQLSPSNTSEASPGTISIGINGADLGPVQLYAWGNYSNGKQVLLGGSGLAYQISVTQDLPLSAEMVANNTPPLTMELSTNGLLTAVTPFFCSWINSAPENATPPVTSPAWGVGGSYSVTATYGGFTSPPFFVAVASASPGTQGGTNPTGECGPSSD
ncbi:MAG: hypothetical protein WBD25_20630 [Terriglobales bacterium]